MGNDEAQGPSVPAFQRRPAEPVGEEIVAGREIGQWKVGRRALFGHYQHMRRPRQQVDLAHQLGNRHPFPVGIELGPFGDAVNVEGSAIRRHRENTW